MFSRRKPEFCVILWGEFPYYSPPFNLGWPNRQVWSQWSFPTKPRHLGRSIEVVVSLVASIPLTFPTCLLHAWRWRKYCHVPEKLQAVSCLNTHTCERYLSKLKLKWSPIIKIVVGLTAQGLMKRTRCYLWNHAILLWITVIYFFSAPPSLVIVVF